MPTAFTSNVPVPYIDAQGCHIPAFAEIYDGLVADYRGIYGADVVLTPDVQDGQWLGIQAAAFNDYCAAFLAAYNAYSPATAQGVGLSSVVNTNGIAREVASYSTCTVTLIGQAGAILTGCVARDEAGYQWSIPNTVIPLAGQVDVTATCLTIGAISAAPGTIDQLATPTLGWQSVTNAAAATPGLPIETDPQLRVRQSQSTMLPSQTVMDGILGALSALLNVARLRGYENDEDIADANGIPGNCIAIVIDGGDSQVICDTILRKKAPGVGTYGTATSPLPSYDAYGIGHTIRYFPPSEPPITYQIALKALNGFTLDYQNQIAQAVSDWTNSLGIGAGTSGMIRMSRVYGPALLAGTAAGNRFEILGISMARDNNPLSSNDIPIAFNEAPMCAPASVQFVVST